MKENKKQVSDNPVTRIFQAPPDKVLKAIKAVMAANIDQTRSIFNLCKEHNLLDSQEFIGWQDELNEISVMYE